MVVCKGVLRHGVVAMVGVLCVVLSSVVLAGQTERVGPAKSASPGRLLNTLPDDAVQQTQDLDVLRKEIHRAREATSEERVRRRQLDDKLRALEQRVRTLMEALKAQDKTYKALQGQSRSGTVPPHAHRRTSPAAQPGS